MARVLRRVLCIKLTEALKAGEILTKYLTQCEVSHSVRSSAAQTSSFSRLIHSKLTIYVDCNRREPQVVLDQIPSECGAYALRKKARLYDQNVTYGRYQKIL